jgi:CRISPR-associated protein Cmr3
MPSEERIQTALTLRPLDTLFFRDGAPFAAGRRPKSGLPAPQTLMGAIRSHLLLLYEADFAKLSRAARDGATMAESFGAAGAPEWIASIGVRGPWLARSRAGGEVPEVYLPAPRHLRLEAGGERWIALTPRKQGLPGWRNEHELLPLWHAQSGRAKETAGGFLSANDMEKCLRGETLSKQAIRAAEELYGYDDKTGIVVDPGTFTAAEGLIYSTRMLALAAGVFLYAELFGPEGCGLREAFARAGPMGFGGESRYVEALPVTPVKWPEVKGERTLAMLASPALFREGWRPDVIPEERIKGAAVGGPFAVSGWDIARGGPKPARFGVAAGSAYFVEGAVDFAGDSLCAAPEDVQQGYGFFLKGVWNYA